MNNSLFSRREAERVLRPTGMRMAAAAAVFSRLSTPGEEESRMRE